MLNSLTVFPPADHHRGALGWVLSAVQRSYDECQDYLLLSLALAAVQKYTHLRRQHPDTAKRAYAICQAKPLTARQAAEPLLEVHNHRLTSSSLAHPQQWHHPLQQMAAKPYKIPLLAYALLLSGRPHSCPV